MIAETNKYARAARAIYDASLTDWLASTVRETSCAFCCIPEQRVGALDLTWPQVRGRCPLPHFIGMRLVSVFDMHRSAKEWEREAVTRRVWRLMTDDYGAPPPEWSPLPDDPHAWALDSEAQPLVDEWGGLS